MRIPWGKSRFPAVAVIPALICFLSAVLPSEAGPARLNNFVVELADVDISRVGARGRVEAEMDMEGWIYILLEGEGEIGVSMTAGGESETVLEEPGETMRYIPAGPVILEVTRGRGASTGRLTVRRVPEIIAYYFQGIRGHAPKVDIRHSWNDWRRSGILCSSNIIVSRARVVYEPYARKWQEDGGRWFRRESIRPLMEENADPAEFFNKILGGEIWDGAFLDEISSRTHGHFDRLADGVSRFSKIPESEGKYIYWWIASLGTEGQYGSRRYLQTVCPEIARSFRPTRETSERGGRSIRSEAGEKGAGYTRQLGIVLEPGEEYTLSAYMRTEGSANSGNTGLFVIDQGWRNVYGRLQPDEGTTGWKRYSVSFVPQESRDGRYQVMLAKPARGTVWFDAVQIERGGEPTEFTVGGKNKIKNPDFGRGMHRWTAGTGESLPLIDAVVKHGHAFVQEMYLRTEETEQKARQRIEKPLELLSEALEMYDGPLHRHVMIAPMLYDVRPGAWSGNRLPYVDYSVFLDMQMHAMATKQGLEDLRGLSFWAAHYASPEIMGWFGELLRHYCIEGNTRRYTDDPYKLTHLVNAGFEEGLEGWEAEGSVEAVAVDDMPEGGFLGDGQQPSVPVGMVVRTVRGEKDEANSFGQPIRNLEPGRLYSLRLYSADSEYSDRIIPAHITIEGGEVRQEGKRTEQFSEEKWSHVWRSQRRSEEVHWTMHFRVFRAAGTEGYLKISDVEQGEVYWDFVQLAPFFEKSGGAGDSAWDAPGGR